MPKVILLDYRRVMNDNDQRAEQSLGDLRDERPT